MLKKKDFRLDKCAFIRRCHPLLIVFQPVCTYILLNYLSVNLEIHQRNWCTRRVNKWNFLCTPPPLFHLCETSPQNKTHPSSLTLDIRFLFSLHQRCPKKRKKRRRDTIYYEMCVKLFSNRIIVAGAWDAFESLQWKIHKKNLIYFSRAFSTRRLPFENSSFVWAIFLIRWRM